MQGQRKLMIITLLFKYIGTHFYVCLGGEEGFLEHMKECKEVLIVYHTVPLVKGF